MIHLRNSKLEAGVYSNSYILPYNLFRTPCLGGVTLGGGRYVKDSTWTEWDDLTAYDFNQNNVEFVERNAIYIGVMMSIFGHTITDNLKKLWFLQSEDGKKLLEGETDILYITYMAQTLPPQVFEILQYAGVDIKKLKLIDKPTKYRAVYVPGNSMISKEIKKNVGEKYYTIDFWETVLHMLDTIPKVNIEGEGRIYLSRTAFRNRRDYGEKRIERLFSKAGYRIVYPEKHPFAEQVALMQYAKEVVATEGSVSHMAMFSKPMTKWVILKKIDWENPYQLCINEMAQVDVVSLDANHSITVECGWEGPFYLSPTKAVCNYLHVEMSDHYLLRLDYYGYLLYFCWSHFPLVKWGKVLAKTVIKKIIRIYV